MITDTRILVTLSSAVLHINTNRGPFIPCLVNNVHLENLISMYKLSFCSICQLLRLCCYITCQKKKKSLSTNSITQHLEWNFKKGFCIVYFYLASLYKKKE